MTITKWYNQYLWPERCRAYDRHMERITLEERESLLKQKAQEISAEHMAMLQTARHLAQVELDKLRAIADETQMTSMRPGEVIKLSEMVIKLDRLIRGESTEEVSLTHDLSRFTTDELRLFKQLNEKARKV